MNIVYVLCPECRGLAAAYPTMQYARDANPTYPPNLFTTQPRGYQACVMVALDHQVRPCDYHHLPLVQGGYHEGATDPEGMDLAFRVPCTQAEPCICPCWPSGCPFLADGPGRQCEPCAAHHPDGLPPGAVVVGHLYPPAEPLYPRP